METVDALVCNYVAHYANGEFDFVGSPDFDSGSYFARCENCDLYGTCYEVTITHIPSSGYDICTVCEGCIYSAEYGDND
jgi:hypothetical protein